MNKLYSVLKKYIPQFFIIASLCTVFYLYGWMAGKISCVQMYLGELKAVREYITEVQKNLEKIGFIGIDFSKKRSKILTKPKILKILEEEKAIIIQPNFAIDDPLKKYLPETIKIIITPQTTILKKIVSPEEEGKSKIILSSFEELKSLQTIYYVEFEEPIINKSEGKAKLIMFREIK